MALLAEGNYSYDFEPPRAVGSLREALESSPSEGAAVAWHASYNDRVEIIGELATQASKVASGCEKFRDREQD